MESCPHPVDAILLIWAALAGVSLLLLGVAIGVILARRGIARTASETLALAVAQGWQVPVVALPRELVRDAAVIPEREQLRRAAIRVRAAIGPATPRADGIYERVALLLSKDPEERPAPASGRRRAGVFPRFVPLDAPILEEERDHPLTRYMQRPDPDLARDTPTLVSELYRAPESPPPASR